MDIDCLLPCARYRSWPSSAGGADPTISTPRSVRISTSQPRITSRVVRRDATPGEGATRSRQCGTDSGSHARRLGLAMAGTSRPGCALRDPCLYTESRVCGRRRRVPGAGHRGEHRAVPGCGRRTAALAAGRGSRPPRRHSHRRHDRRARQLRDVAAGGHVSHLARDRGATAGVLGRLRVGHGSLQPGDRRRDSSGDGPLGERRVLQRPRGAAYRRTPPRVRRTTVPGARRGFS